MTNLVLFKWLQLVRNLAFVGCDVGVIAFKGLIKVAHLAEAVQFTDKIDEEEGVCKTVFHKEAIDDEVTLKASDTHAY